MTGPLAALWISSGTLLLLSGIGLSMDGLWYGPMLSFAGILSITIAFMDPVFAGKEESK